MANYSKDVEAQVTFLIPEEGGRKCPIICGYRPTFIYDNNWWDAAIHFEGLDLLPKGKPVNVYFSFSSPQHHVGHLFPGKEFQLWDGRVIANGIILKIMDLEISASH